MKMRKKKKCKWKRGNEREVIKKIYFEATVQHFTHYTTKTLPIKEKVEAKEISRKARKELMKKNKVGTTET